MPYIGEFGDVDPYWEEKQLAQLGQIGQTFAGAIQQRKALKEQRQQEEIDDFFRRAAQYPELIETQGPALAEKYGESVPWLPGALDAMKRRTELPRQLDEAGQKWLSRADQLSAEASGSQAMLQQMGMAPLPIGGSALAGAVMDPMADQAGVAREQAMATAARELSPTERLRAQVWAKDQGGTFPEIDPLTQEEVTRRLPAKVKAVAAAEGAIPGVSLPPDTSRAARIGGGLELGEDKLQYERMKKVEEKRLNEQLELKWEDLKVRQLQTKTASARERRLSQKQAAGGGAAATKPLSLASIASALTSDSQVLAKEYDQRFKGAKPRTITDREGERKTVKRVQGFRPEPLLRSQANAMARRVHELSQDPTEQALFTEQFLKLYQQYLGMGIPRDEAVRHVIDGTEPEMKGRSAPILQGR